MKSIDLNENMGFKSTVFWCLFLKTWCFSLAKNGIILSGYFCAAKCGNLLGRWEFDSNITQKVAILQAKIIPTSAAAEEERIKWSLVRRGEFFVYFFASRQKSEWVWVKPIKKKLNRLFEAQLTTLITLKAQYQITNILAAIIINITIVFIVLKITSRL